MKQILPLGCGKHMTKLFNSFVVNFRHLTPNRFICLTLSFR